MAPVPWTKRPLNGAALGVTSLHIPLDPSRPKADTRPARQAAVKVRDPGGDTLHGWTVLTAASKRVDRTNAKDKAETKARPWQQEAWSFYNQVGELHYTANVHANTVGRVGYPLARLDENGEIVLLESLEEGAITPADRLAKQAMREFCGYSTGGMGEMSRAAALQLFVAGEGLLIGTPPTDHDGEIGSEDPGGPVDRLNPEGADLDADEKLLNLTWKIYSTDDVREVNGQLKIAGKLYDPADILEIKIWRKHPQFSNTPDSPVLAILPILRELVGLTMHISATIDSRLAGAGILILPQSAVALGASAPEEASDVDPLVEAIIEAAITPIKDRDSAAAVVPVIIKVPDDSVAGIQHISFATPFDAGVKDLIDHAIRRAALGMDAPPETVLGLGESSHWNAWAIQEDNIRLHVLPAASIIAEAVVRDYLRPVLEELGVPPEVAETYFLMPEADELIARPNRTQDAIELFRLGALSREALLRESGFDPADAPAEQEELDPAIIKALELVTAAPSLMQDPGLPEIVRQIKEVLSGIIPTEPPVDPAAPDPDTDAPDAEAPEPSTPDQPGPPEQGAPE